MYGPDVSDWQGRPDWAAVRTLCDFGVCKATEGFTNVQTTLEYNRSEMARVQMQAIGLYHFARPEKGDPVGQADHFCRTVGALRDREFPVLDIETGSTGSWPAFISAFCQRVVSLLGRTCVVYMSESPAGSMPASVAKWPLWDAGYVNRYPVSWDDSRITGVGPWPLSSVWLWQFTSSYQCPGIDGTCDMNVAPHDLPARLGFGVADIHPSIAPADLRDPINPKEFDLQNCVMFGIPNNGGVHLALLSVGVKLWIHTPAEIDAFKAAGCPFVGESVSLAALPSLPDGELGDADPVPHQS